MNDNFELDPTIEELVKDPTRPRKDLEGDELTEDEWAELQDWFLDLDEEEIC